MTRVYQWMYELTYRFSKPNWERDVVPSQVASLAEKQGGQRRALDLGCGTGAHSIYLAQHGLTVVGVDYSRKAIEMARDKARRAGASVDFQIGDVTRLDFLREPFDVVLDVGCFHGLDAAGRVRYASHVARLTRQGSTFLLWAFDRASHLGIAVTPEEARQSFAPTFVTSRIEPEMFQQRSAAWYWFTRP
jgi:SAM-dependent methyltransferase